MKKPECKIEPPHIPLWMIQRLFRCENREEYAGDIEEEFADIQLEQGRKRALYWIWKYAFLALPMGLYSFYIWRLTMFRNYLKITLRNIRKHKGFSLINFSGLVIGLTCFMLIMLFVRFELDFDRIHGNGDRIHRVVFNASMENSVAGCAVTPAPLASKLMNDLPEVEKATKIWPIDRLLLTKEKRSFFERGIYADEEFFNIFSFPLIKGDRETVLKNLFSIVITEKLARKYFPNEDPIGKIISTRTGDLMVTAIAADIPENSHIQFDWVIPFATAFAPEERDERMNRWNLDNYYTYVLLKEKTRVEDFEDKANSLLSDHYMALKSSTGQDWWKYRAEMDHYLQPLHSIHLKSHIRYEFSANGDIRMIRLFILIAVFILIIACINAVNLSTAMASKRAKEIGVRKVVGAQRRQLIKQLLGESFIITGISFVLALGLANLLLPGFNRLIDRTLTFHQLWSGFLIPVLPLIGLLTSFLSGVYPAFYLTAFQPYKVLRGRIGGSRERTSARNFLVIFQFAVTITLIISGVVIFSQLHYIKTRNIGFDREQIAVMRGSDPGLKENFQAFKNILRENPQVISLATANQLPTNVSRAGGIPIPNDQGELVRQHAYFIGTDYDFLDMMGMELIKGRNFSRDFGTDKDEAVIVNETYVNRIGWKEPIGKRLNIVSSEKQHEIVGVVKDFHFFSMRHEIEPLVITLQPDSYFTFVRLRPERITQTIGFIEGIYSRFRTRYPFEYFFLDDQFNRLYRSEEKLSRIILYFSALAVFIACLGIFGLSMARAEKRTKEIGIRKVLGAKESEIAGLLIKDFLRLVLAANLLAWPAAYIAMQSWLQEFTYRIGLGIEFFLLSSLLTMVIALMATASQSIKAAVSPPVRSLRYE